MSNVFGENNNVVFTIEHNFEFFFLYQLVFKIVVMYLLNVCFWRHKINFNYLGNISANCHFQSHPQDECRKGNCCLSLREQE